MPAPKPDTRVEGTPLPPHRLAAIWSQLPEGDRFGFLLALSDDCAARLLHFQTEQRKRPAPPASVAA